MKRSHFRFLKEVLIIIFLIVIQNNFLCKKNLALHEPIINSDGRGYYEYLPAIFIYNDLHFSYLDTLHSEFYPFETSKDFYPRQKDGNRIDKYFVGTAVFQAPFFLYSHVMAKAGKSVPDGFSLAYQRGMFYSAIFYLFIGLIFLRLLLQTYDVNRWWIIFAQLTTLFATPLVHYTLNESAYSHVYSFFLITGFLYFFRSFLLKNEKNQLLLTAIFLGFIVIVRPVNILILLFTPTLADSLEVYLSRLKSLLTAFLPTTIVSVFAFLAILSIQFFISFLQTGNPFSYNYGNEKFYFLQPHFVDFLFSYRKGFFLWTPWWFAVFLIGGFMLFRQKKYYYLASFLSAFGILTYVLSSWYAWSYGGSLGQRPMIGYYSAFTLLLVPIVKYSSALWKCILVFLSLPLIYVMQIQTIQYEKAIIGWDEMTKERYWEVFLNTNDKYSWYFWKKPFLVGEKQHSVKLGNPIQIQRSSFDTTFVFPKDFFDKASYFGEIKMKFNREADKETMTFYLLDQQDSVLYKDLQRLFYNNENRVNFLYRFKLPENSTKISKIKFYIEAINTPLTIKSTNFTTYKSVQ